MSGSRWCGKVSRAALALACVGFLTCGPARAEGDQERAGARAAAEAGANRFDEGQWQEAITLFEKAESLVHAAPHLLYIARAQEKLGHLVEAREAYLKITREPVQAKAPAAFRSAHSAAEAEAAALEPRIPYLSVSVQGAGELPVRVMMDGAEVPQGLVGVPRPMNPGTYGFQAFAAGNQSNPSSITLREGAKETVILTLQSEPKTSAAPAGEAKRQSLFVDSTESGVPDSGGGGMNGLVVGGIVGLGVGVAGGVLGTVFALDSGSKRDDADALCNQAPPAPACPSGARAQVSDLDDQASAAKTRAIVSYVVGGVGLATGATLLVLGLNKGSSHEARGPRVVPWVSLNSAGVSGTF
jgi:hypothetical protein